MKKLKVKQPDGTWAWVFCRRMPERTLMTTPKKHLALPSTPIHADADLAWAKDNWPDRAFELGAAL